jgi:hypothetical protein
MQQIFQYSAIAEQAGEGHPLDHTQRRLEDLLSGQVQKARAACVIKQHYGAGQAIDPGQARHEIATAIDPCRQ